MKKASDKSKKSSALLLTYQETARSLGVTKTDVRTMVDDGLLREVRVGDKPRITALSVVHTLGCDPFGLARVEPGGAGAAPTLEQYAVRLLNRGVGQAHSRTIENYRASLSLTAKELGGMRLDEIGGEDLRRAFRQLEGKYANSSLRRAYAVTCRVLRAAYEAGDIPTDPTACMKPPKSTKPRRGKEGQVYSDADCAEILRTSKEYSRELYTMFAVLECTGMRPGELLALEWSSYNRGARTIHIYQAVTRQYGTIRALEKSAKSKSVLSVPKTEYSVRTLRLSDTAARALDEWRDCLRKGGDRAKARSRFIFPGRRGRFRSLSGAEKLLQQYRAACGIEGVTFYKFRHTMCTRLVLDRQPIAVIQRILGDNSPDVITRVYTHIYAADALRAMDDYFAARERNVLDARV